MVLMLACPMRSCITRKGTPCWARWAAKVWRKEWILPGMPALRASRLKARERAYTV